MAVFILMIVQFILGFISNALWKEARTAVPWWDKVHWFLGGFVLILAIATLFTGLNIYDTHIGTPLWAWIVTGVVVGLGVISLFAGQLFFNNEKKNTSSSA